MVRVSIAVSMVEVPKNVTLLALPPYSPELNPIERVWSYLKRNFLSGRIFKDMEDIFDHGVRAWQALEEKAIQSICGKHVIA